MVRCGWPAMVSDGRRCTGETGGRGREAGQVKEQGKGCFGTKAEKGKGKAEVL